MSTVPESIRLVVANRAGNRCEYCRIPAEGQVARFPVDHIIARTAGGESDLDNLAPACPHCNAYQWAFVRAMDAETGVEVALFHPRAQIWSEHFRVDPHDPSLLQGLTPCGRATIDRLLMNYPNLVRTRVLLLALGLYP